LLHGHQRDDAFEIVARCELAAEQGAEKEEENAIESNKSLQIIPSLTYIQADSQVGALSKTIW
jgi:hypothetical protein